MFIENNVITVIYRLVYFKKNDNKQGKFIRGRF